MKFRWLFLVAMTLVVACQKAETPPAPSGTGSGDSASSAARPPDVAAADDSTRGSESDVKEENDPGTEETAAAPTVAGLIEGFNKSMQEWSAKVSGAKPEDRAELLRARPNPQGVYNEIKKVIEGNDSPDDRFAALMFGAQNLRDLDAIRTLVNEFTDRGEQLVPMVMNLNRMLPPQEAKELLEKIAGAEGENPLKGIAMFGLASSMAESDPDRAEAMLTEVVEKYGETPVGAGRTLADTAGPVLFEMKNLAIGKEAPDIEGADLDGVAFKLSDYRGKVVVLDFWGDW